MSLAFNNNPEDNPFADPFARPRSPDPWTSYGQQEDPPAEEPSKTQSAAASSNPSPHAIFSPSPADEPASPSVQFDPSESLATSQSLSIDRLEPAPDSPGQTVKSDTPVQTPATEQLPEQLPTPDADTPTHAPSAQEKPFPQARPEPVTQPRQPSVSQRTAPTQTIRSPLDLPLPQASTSLHVPTHGYNSEHHFAGLSLGGETPGAGWRMADPDTTDTSSEKDSAPVQHRTTNGVDQATKPTEEIATVVSHAPAPIFVITVDDPQKVGDAIRGYTMYTVNTRTNSPQYTKSSFSVLRRYSEFLWLYDTLSFNNPGVIVPPVPEKNPFGRFQDTFVEQRRLGLQQCIQKIANHPVLSRDPDLQFFLESDNFALDMKHRRGDGSNTAERGGLMASIGSSLVGTKFFEIDEWFDQKKVYFESLEAQLRGLGKAIDTVSKSRQEMSSSLHEFSETLSELANADLGKAMVVSFATLADVERKSKELQDAHARQDTITLLNTVDEYTRLISSVRLAFASRVRLHVAWQTADNDVRRVRATQEKARKQGRLPVDRTAHSMAEIQDAERRAVEAKREFDKASRLIKTEVARFEKERVEDFKESLEDLLSGMISRQKEIIKAWEGYQELVLRRTSPSVPAPAPAEPVQGPQATGDLIESDHNPFAS